MGESRRPGTRSVIIAAVKGLVLGVLAWLLFMHVAITMNGYWLKVGPASGDVPWLNRNPGVPLVLIVGGSVVRSLYLCRRRTHER